MDLIIRKLKENDFETLYGLLSDPQVMRYLEEPYTQEKAEQFIVNAGLSDPPLIYAVDQGDTMIGYVIFHEYDETGMEIGWVLHPRYWGKGYASYLTKLLMEKTLELGKQPVIECDSEQKISKHIALKHEFEYKGSFDGLDVFRLENQQDKTASKE